MLVPALKSSLPAPRRAPARKKWIPNGDLAFAEKVGKFAKLVAKDHVRLGVSQADAEALSDAATEFRAVFQAVRFEGKRGPGQTIRKAEARSEAERLMRRVGRLIRANDALDAVTLSTLGLTPRAEKPGPAALPKEPPRLKFVRARHEGGGSVPVHELEFREPISWSKARPAGAARIELFVDLVAPDEPIPAHPGANLGGRPWYLRSYTRNPIILTPPMARVPMRVVYWARWADTLGNVGPFSATAVGWVEGGSHLPRLAPRREPLKLLDADARGPADRDEMILVTVMEAQYQSYHPTATTIPITPTPNIADALPGGEAPRQIEGPAEPETEPRAAA